MVYNGILMETIGISVMVSIGLLFFLSGPENYIPEKKNCKVLENTNY